MSGRRSHKLAEERYELTERQREVVRLVERGYSNFEIAEELGITLDGAKYHLSEILGKLGVASREDAVGAWRASERRGARPWAAVRGFFALQPVRWVAGAALAGAAAVVVVVGIAGRDDGGDQAAGGETPTPPAQPPLGRVVATIPVDG
ncbi:MAG: helix-turn-helix domain-containing protein, partial [Tepidiformaceae bacterium]